MKNNLLHKFDKNKTDKRVMAGAVALSALIPATTPVFAGSWGYTGMSGDGVMTGFKGTMIGAAQFLGGMWAIAAVFFLVMALRNEDNEGRNKAAINLVAGIALLSFGTILNLFFS